MRIPSGVGKAHIFQTILIIFVNSSSVQNGQIVPWGRWNPVVCVPPVLMQSGRRRRRNTPPGTVSTDWVPLGPPLPLPSPLPSDSWWHPWQRWILWVRGGHHVSPCGSPWNGVHDILQPFLPWWDGPSTFGGSGSPRGMCQSLTEFRGTGTFPGRRTTSRGPERSRRGPPP